MKEKLQSQITDFDRLIREGRASEVRQGIRSKAWRKIPREILLPLANVARRADMPTFAARLLNPIVRPTDSRKAKATQAEIAEYAICLAKLGLYEEGVKLIDAVDAEKFPEALLSKTFALVAQWNYADTIPLLKRYIKNPAVGDYQRLVGKANLAAAFVHERLPDEGEPLLDDLLRSTKGKFNFLYAKILDLCAQNSIQQKDWKASKRYIDESESLLKDSGGVDALFVRKWRAFQGVLQTKGSKASLTGLQKVRDEAVAHPHWETIRQCDALRAVVLKEEALATHVYYGTQYEPFRKRLWEDYGPTLRLPSTYRWDLGQTGKRKELDLTDPSGKHSVLYRMLSILASDFYRPFKITLLHHYLYPDEHFNPFSAPDRVHQVIKRLRQWLDSTEIPLEIEVEGKSYRLNAQRACSLILSTRTRERFAHSKAIPIIREKLGSKKEFTATELSRSLGISPRSALGLLQNWLEEKTVKRVGKGRATRYFFPT